MRRGHALAPTPAVALLAVLAGCPTPSPGPAPAPPSSADVAVYGQLVAAGCLGPSDGGAAAVQAEHRSRNPSWLACLYDGGTVAGCRVPCDPPPDGAGRP